MRGHVHRPLALVAAALVGFQGNSGGTPRRPFGSTSISQCQNKPPPPTTLQHRRLFAGGVPDTPLTNDRLVKTIPLNQYTPTLHIAASSGSVQVATDLIANGANVNASDVAGTTPLMVAASLGDQTMCQLLLDANADLDATAVDGSTALHVAAYHGQLDIVTLLLQAGADMYATRPDGIDLLHIAIREGHRQLVAALLLAKDPYILTEFHLEIASKWGHDQLVADVVSAQPHLVTFSVVNAAVESGRLATTRILLAGITRPSDLRQAIVNGALLHAAATGQLAVLQLLLEEGAEITATDDIGNSVVHWAVRHNHLDVLLCVLHHFPDQLIPLLSTPNHAGEFPVHLAARGGHWTMLQRLEGLGMSLHERCLTNGFTPLHVAVMHGHFKAVTFLHARGCNFHQPTEYLTGKSASDLAAQHGHDEIAQFIAQHQREPSQHANAA
ncbi:hypothetical protein, variant 1 [Aphanomyces astaci]|uniref:Uncharacterized protein n=2 Tax=Aphanomyces astaci TaxID=112090 RepID=W4FCS4_APHAT|nr:hypothetical protein, variant 1 [Aphanomyces astaci]ETV64694.1 hypothetical protein, variant 1 [Aphanomyces astaci]|eukprot:XP_009845830.1 hypothetical protein, variant 1 [Aphanomyces astaci]